VVYVLFEQRSRIFGDNWQKNLEPSISPIIGIPRPTVFALSSYPYGGMQRPIVGLPILTLSVAVMSCLAVLNDDLTSVSLCSCFVFRFQRVHVTGLDCCCCCRLSVVFVGATFEFFVLLGPSCCGPSMRRQLLYPPPIVW